VFNTVKPSVSNIRELTPEVAVRNTADLTLAI